MRNSLLFYFLCLTVFGNTQSSSVEGKWYVWKMETNIEKNVSSIAAIPIIIFYTDGTLKTSVLGRSSEKIEEGTFQLIVEKKLLIMTINDRPQEMSIFKLNKRKLIIGQALEGLEFKIHLKRI